MICLCLCLCNSCIGYVQTIWSLSCLPRYHKQMRWWNTRSPFCQNLLTPSLMTRNKMQWIENMKPYLLKYMYDLISKYFGCCFILFNVNHYIQIGIDITLNVYFVIIKCEWCSPDDLKMKSFQKSKM